MKTIVHVNQHIIKSNRKHNKLDPVLTCKTYKTNKYANEVKIMKDGEVVATIVYRPNAPLSCGAHCWIETENEVVTGD
jgi:hypothetical protein